MKFINVFMDNRGLWSASLCKDAKELDNIGGSYPKAINATRDAQQRWGRDLEVKTSYTPMFFSDELKLKAIHLFKDGLTSDEVAKRLDLKPAQARAVKAHVTMGTYDKMEYLDSKKL